MANSKKPRKKGKGIFGRKAVHISSVINRCMSKFHVIGDMNHRPTAFHFADISMHLKGEDLRIGLEHVMQFLCELKQPWTFMAFHYFKDSNGEVECIPVAITLDDVTYNDIGEQGEDILKQLRESVYNSDPRYNDDTLLFYGYYFTHGKGLALETVEDKLIENFLKVNKDLEEIKEHVVEITKKKLLYALEADKYSLVNSEALKTTFINKELTV